VTHALQERFVRECGSSGPERDRPSEHKGREKQGNRLERERRSSSGMWPNASAISDGDARLASAIQTE
jgi:hypothetical protein